MTLINKKKCSYNDTNWIVDQCMQDTKIGVDAESLTNGNVSLSNDMVQR